jgi:hypothetical protein
MFLNDFDVDFDLFIEHMNSHFSVGQSSTAFILYTRTAPEW